MNLRLTAPSRMACSRGPAKLCSSTGSDVQIKLATCLFCIVGIVAQLPSVAQRFHVFHLTDNPFGDAVWNSSSAIDNYFDFIANFERRTNGAFSGLSQSGRFWRRPSRT